MEIVSIILFAGFIYLVMSCFFDALDEELNDG